MASDEHIEAVGWVLERLTPTDTRATVKALELRWGDLTEELRHDTELFAQVGAYFENNEETLKEVWPRLPNELKVFVKRYQLGHSKFVEDEPDQ